MKILRERQIPGRWRIIPERHGRYRPQPARRPEAGGALRPTDPDFALTLGRAGGNKEFPKNRGGALAGNFRSI
jgi:hypothetical protein